jgi:hypothetical protein
MDLMNTLDLIPGRRFDFVEVRRSSTNVAVSIKFPVVTVSDIKLMTSLWEPFREKAPKYKPQIP